MYCRCNYCHTQFAVSAAQLRAGRGQVRCGTCMTVFDALDTLTDEIDLIAPAKPASGDAAAASGSLAEPVAEAPASGGTRADPPLGTLGGGTDDEVAESGIVGPLDAGARLSAAPAPAEETDAGAPIPEVLREDMARLASARRRRRAAIGFGIGSVLLLAALVLQWAWFEPADVLSRFPQARPWIERLCERTGCLLPERRDASRVRMITRDVRVHPRYEGALRVSASLMNTAPFTQPFPRLKFTLFNVNGQVIASRIFEPREYLPGDVDPASEMRPRVPVQIALELLAPEDTAVSFEFDFL